MYTKFQLALRYFPESIDRPETAVHRLRTWIRRNRELSQELIRAGSRTYDKEYTQRQVDIIFKYLGEPDEP